MSYRKNQGRYARMVAFWVLTLLLGYGFFNSGGLVDYMARWFGGVDRVLVESFPLVSQLRLSTFATIAVFGVVVVVIHRILNQPRLADLLIDTETEMQKVTWPGWGEVMSGTLAVASMVAILFLFLTGIDLVLTQAIQGLMPGVVGGP